MNTGDKLKFLEYNALATFIKPINQYYILVEDEYGFELKVHKKEVVLIRNPATTLDYGHQTYDHSKLTSSPVVIVDLHIECISKHSQHLSSWEIPLKQMIYFKQQLNKAIEQQVSRLVVIHGKGEGTLRAKVVQEIRKHIEVTGWNHLDEHKNYNEGVTTVYFH